MSTRDTKKTSNNKRNSIVVAIVLAVIAAAGWFIGKLSPHDRKKIMKTYKREAVGAFHLVLGFFVPHHTNEYKPRIFHSRATRNILIAVLVAKVALVSTLFVFFPNAAKLSADVRAEMYGLINQYRAESGTHILTSNAYLESAARAKARDMIEENYFSHYGPDGTKPWQWLDASIYDFKSMGENLAMDFITSGAVFRAFQNSPTHDANLINEKYTEIGIAVAPGYLDGHNTNVMVVFFASPKTAKLDTILAAAEPAGQPIQPPVAPEALIDEPVEETVTSNEPATPPSAPVDPFLEPETVPEAVTDETPAESVAEENSEPSLTVERLDDLDGTEVLGEAISEAPDVDTENLLGGVVFSQGSFVQRLIAWSDRFFVAVLMALVLLLLINIFVKIRVQHAPALVNASMLILVAAAAYFVDIHRVEAIGEKVRILSQMLL